MPVLHGIVLAMISRVGRMTWKLTLLNITHVIQLAVAPVFLLSEVERHAAADSCRLNVSDGITTLEIC